MFSRRWFLQVLSAAAGTALVPTHPEPLPRRFPEPETIDAELLEDESPQPTQKAISRPTRLEVFLKSRGIKPNHLAHDSGYSRAHLLKVRMGRIEPTLRCKVHLVASLRRLSRERVTIRDIFPGPFVVFPASRQTAPPSGRVGASRQRLLMAGRRGSRWSR